MAEPQEWTPEEAAPKKKRGRPRKQVSTPTEEIRPQTIEQAINLQDDATKAAVADLAITFSQLLLIATVLTALAAQQPVLAMSNKEAAAIAKPLANIVSKTNLFRKYGRSLTESHDYIALGWALYTYSTRVIGGWHREPKPAAVFDTGHLERSSGPGEGTNPLSQRVNTNPFAGAEVSPKGQSGTPFFGWRSD